MITIHFFWLFCLMILCAGSVCFIVYDKKTAAKHQDDNGALIRNLRNEIESLKKSNALKSERILELEDKQQLVNQSPEGLSSQIIELQNENRELSYRWNLLKNWAIYLQKKYYGESEQERRNIEKRLTECKFKLVHYDAQYMDLFSIQNLTRMPDEPDSKETQPALVFMNEGRTELISKGIFIQFV